MKGDCRLCGTGKTKQAVISAFVWFSFCMLLSSFSLYSLLCLLLHNTSLEFPSSNPIPSIFWPLFSEQTETSTEASDKVTMHTNSHLPASLIREEQVLLAFKDRLEEDPVGVLDSWYVRDGEEGYLCAWIGITCDAHRQHVVALNLAGMELKGVITGELQFLTSLTTLNLSSNRFSGSIPAEVGQIKELQYLDLSKNQLSGSIPVALGALRRLEGLWLHDNVLAGTIPHSLGGCPRLITLDVSHNTLRGSIPAHFGQLQHLEMLQLSDNSLTGSLPAALAHCSALKVIDVRKNELEGKVNLEVCNLQHLQALDLSTNRFTGEIAELFASCTNLKFLSLNDNGFTGVLPTGILNSRALVYLSLRNNKLKGNLPDNLTDGFTSSLRHIDVSCNQLTGSIPTSFAQFITFIRYVNLSNNYLYGPLPPELVSMRLPVGKDYSRKSIEACFAPDQDGTFGPRLLRYLIEVDGDRPGPMRRQPKTRVLDLSTNALVASGRRSQSLYNISSLPLVGEDTIHAWIDRNECDLPFKKGKDSGLRNILVNFIPITVVMGLVALGVFIWFSIHRSYHSQKSRGEFLIHPEVRIFPFRHYSLKSDEIRRAAEGLYEYNIIGKGRLGWVYKVDFGGERYCAVKTVVRSLLSHREQRRLIQELQVLGSLRHRNIVKLLGYFSDAKMNALVYEFMPNGSLDMHLMHPQVISMENRFAILLDIAEALAYLHHHFASPVVHGNLKPINIFVNFDFSGAQVGGVGLGKYVKGVSHSRAEHSLKSSDLERRSQAYSAPELLDSITCEIMDKSVDVYSFGVILLELVTGINPATGCSLCSESSTTSWSFDNTDPAYKIRTNLQIWRCIDVARLCTNTRPEERPTMHQILQLLTQIIRLS